MQQAATQGSTTTSTGTQAKYSGRVTGKHRQEAATRGAKRLQSTAPGFLPRKHSPDGAN